MKKDTMVLKDGNCIDLEECSSLASIKVISESRSSMTEVWEKMSDENLKQVKIKNSNGVIVGSYENLMLVSETSTVQTDGTILTSFCLREKTTEEIRLDNLEENRKFRMERLLILRRLLREVLSDDPFLCQENYRWENEIG